MVPHFVMPKKMVQLFIEKFPIDKEGTAAKQLELFHMGLFSQLFFLAVLLAIVGQTCPCLPAAGLFCVIIIGRIAQAGWALTQDDIGLARKPVMMQVIIGTLLLVVVIVTTIMAAGDDEFLAAQSAMEATSGEKFDKTSYSYASPIVFLLVGAHLFFAMMSAAEFLRNSCRAIPAAQFLRSSLTPRISPSAAGPHPPLAPRRPRQVGLGVHPPRRVHGRLQDRSLGVAGLGVQPLWRLPVPGVADGLAARPGEARRQEHGEERDGERLGVPARQLEEVHRRQIFERGSGAQLSPALPRLTAFSAPRSLRRCTGGIFGDTFKKIYDSIDVLIGGGPLILDKSTGYDAYKLYKYNHTVPIYIFYATVCDNIDVTVQSRVPLPGLKESMAAAVKAFADAPERAPSEAKLSSLDPLSRPTHLVSVRAC